MVDNIPLRVTRIDDVALGIKAFELAHVEGQPLAPVEAGAHIALQLPNHRVRHYSLLNTPGETHRYRIAVHLMPDGSGGSRYMHGSVTVGDVLMTAPPRNNFPLTENAPYTCLIAGGIGVTPLMSMIERLNALGRAWELHYCTRTPEHAAFVNELDVLASRHGNALHRHHDQVAGGKPLDIAGLVAGLPADTHVYCCGPKRMLESFEAATVSYAERRHVEYFSAKDEAATEGGFEVELRKSGKVLMVPKGRTILDVVGEAGVSVPSSCREGICGTCETRILSGEADHRDALLTDDEKAANQTMMICCSGSRSACLILDL